MQNKIQILRSLLQRMIDRIDSGNSNATDKELDGVIDTLSRLTNNDVTFTKEQACRYLRISPATFNNHRRNGWIPQGKKELCGALKWTKQQLDDYCKNYKR